jgi:metal-responsive CopG/Arc/MetJ family transcriptional regulator
LGRIIQASDIFRKDMYELILIQESLINDIDTLIKHTENHKEREEIITDAVEKFIESPTKEKIQRHSKRT